jgi:hypothetical protein
LLAYFSADQTGLNCTEPYDPYDPILVQTMALANHPMGATTFSATAQQVMED